MNTCGKMISCFSVRRSFSTCRTTYKNIEFVTVVGGGTMGNGISQVAAQSGNVVTLFDLNEKSLAKAKSSMEKSLKQIAKKRFKGEQSKADNFVQETLSRVTFSTNMNAAVENADLVMEAIFENLETKRKLFQELDKVAPAKTIFASNTSSFPISEVAGLTERKDRFGGLHFFSPVPLMKLLEVIRISETSDETFEKINTWGTSIGKVTVSCKDTPGFIVNRLLIPYTLDALEMLDRGDATLEDIDTAMKLGAGLPMGPFELGDYVGLDISLDIREGLNKRYPDDPCFKVPEILRKKVKEGKLGVKSGEGWYKYDKKN